MCSIDLKVVTINRMIHLKVILIFSPGIGRHFPGNTLNSSDDFIMQPIHILHFLTINIFYKHPEEGIQRSQLWRTRGPENASLPSYQIIRPVQKCMKMARKVRWCTM
jgi:hypothetical protein